MAKVVSQKTFNDVVQENMDEFDMDEEEAVKDAVVQFETQGVNLSNIIKYPSKVHEIEKLVKNLEELTSKETMDDSIIKTLQLFSAAIANEISCQLLAAEKGAYKILIGCFKKSEGKVKVQAIESLISLLDGYPDLLDVDGINLILGLLEPSTPPELLEAGLRWLKVSVSKHEKTRSAMINGQIAAKLKALLESCGEKEEIVGAACNAIQVLIMDDDVRVTHGDTHEHGRALANQLLQLLIQVLTKHISNVTLTGQLLSVLSSLLIRNEFCIEFHENEGLKGVLDAMVEHPDDENVSRQCFLLLKGLAGSDEVKEPIIAAGAGPLLVACMEKHYKKSEVAIAACMCLGALTLRSPVNSRALSSCGAPETLVRCLFHWKKNRTIMKHGCSAIRNQLCRCDDLKEEYQNLHVVELLLEAGKIHGDLGFEAKSVLLDLGCEVKLKEEWKGTGIQMQQ